MRPRSSALELAIIGFRQPNRRRLPRRTAGPFPQFLAPRPACPPLDPPVPLILSETTSYPNTALARRHSRGRSGQRLLYSRITVFSLLRLRLVVQYAPF